MAWERWTAAEDALFRIPGLTVTQIADRLPGRTFSAVKTRCDLLKIPRQDRTWTAAEDAILRAGGRPKGRSVRARNTRRHLLKIAPSRPVFPTWTAEEDAALREGRPIVGRSPKAIEIRRGRIGVSVGRKWSPLEVVALGANPHELDRSKKAIEMKRYKLKLVGLLPVTVASAGSSAQALMQAVERAVPRTLPRHIRDDVIGTLTLDVLEGNLAFAGIEGAVRKALAGVFKLHPMKFGDLSLDAPVAGFEGMRFGDRFTAEDALWARAS